MTRMNAWLKDPSTGIDLFSCVVIFRDFFTFCMMKSECRSLRTQSSIRVRTLRDRTSTGSIAGRGNYSQW